MTEAQRTMKLAEEANARKAEKFERKCNAYAKYFVAFATFFDILKIGQFFGCFCGQKY